MRDGLMARVDVDKMCVDVMSTHTRGMTTEARGWGEPSGSSEVAWFCEKRFLPS